MSSDNEHDRPEDNNNAGMAPETLDPSGKTDGGHSSPTRTKTTVVPPSTVQKKNKKRPANSSKNRRLNKIRKAALESGLNDSGDSFKRSAKNRKPCHEKMQRKIETDCFALGVLQLEQDTIATIMNCEDLTNPRNAEEATAITKMCLYGNLMIPKKVYALVKDVTLNAKFLFTSMPFTECKDDCLAYARYRDVKYHLLRSLKDGGEQDDTAKGGMSDLSDVVETRTHADKMGFPFNNRAEEIADPPTKDALTSIILGQRVRARQLHHYGIIALRELHRHLGAFKDCVKIHADDDVPFIMPELSALMDKVMAKRTDPKNSMPRWEEP